MSDRDTEQTRKNIDRVARGFRDLAHKTGNTGYTMDQARRRVSEARRKGDMKREDNNR